MENTHRYKKYYHSPLRYVGGKSRAIKSIIPFIPKNINTLCSPFFGGGSIELFCATFGIKVYGYDFFLPLVEFWQTLLQNPRELAKCAEAYLPLSKETFKNLKETYRDEEDKTERAAIFYVLNRSSYSGTTFLGGISIGHERFNTASIERLRNFESDNISVQCKDFKESIKMHENDFLYLDPPYAIETVLYGHKEDKHKKFEHEALFEIIKHRKNWILSYNDCERIRNLYKNYEIVPLKWRYGMNKTKKSNEILIIS